MKSRRKRIVVDISEDVVNPAVLKQILLDTKNQIKDGVSSVGISVWFLHLLDKHTKRKIEFIRSQLQNVCLKRLLVFSLSSKFLQLSIFSDNPMFPSIDS